MKLILLSPEPDLFSPLQRSGYFSSVENVSSISTIAGALDADVLVIDSAIMDQNSLAEFLGNQGQSNKVKMFYMLSEKLLPKVNDQIIHLCESRNVVVIPSITTTNQTTQLIITNLFPNAMQKYSKVVAFFGAASDVGTSMVSHSVAEMLAQNTKQKVALFILNDSMGTYYTKLRDDEDVSLDEIKAELWSRVLTPKKLMQTCVQRENLFILQAPRYLPDMRHFHPEHVEQLLDLALEEFGIIVIDAGASYNLGLTIGVLQSVKNKFLVTTQQEKPRMKFERIESQIFKSLQLKTSDFMIIINKFIKDAAIYSGKQMADLYKMMLVATSPHLEFIGWQAEVDRKTLIHFNNPEYTEQIQIISKLIARQVKVEYREQEIEKVSFIKKLIGRKGPA